MPEDDGQEGTGEMIQGEGWKKWMGSLKESFEWILQFAPLKNQTKDYKGMFSEKKEWYWQEKEGEDHFWNVEKSFWQLWSGGSSLVLRERRSGLLTFILYSQYLLLGFTYYVVVFQFVFEGLDAKLYAVDSSGSLSAIFSTLILIFCFLIAGLLCLPCFMMNNIRASSQVTMGSLIYYALVLCFAPIYNLWNLNVNRYLEQYQLAILIIGSIYSGAGFTVGTYLCVLSFQNPTATSFSNWIRGCRLYTKIRLDALFSKKDDSVSSTNLLAKALALNESNIVIKNLWAKRRDTDTLKLIKKAWLPSTYVLQDIDPLFVPHDAVLAAMSFGLVLLVFVSLQIPTAADAAYDSVGELIAGFENATLFFPSNLTNVPLAESVKSFLESNLGFWQGLQLPLYQSILIGGFMAIGWSVSFIPSLWSGFKRTSLELRMGIVDQPGFLSYSRTATMAPYRAMFLFGTYVSCVAFLWLLGFVVFFLLVLLFAWSPFLKLVWALNWLWLPSLVMILVNTIIYSGWLAKRYHTKIKAESRTSLTLTRPREWAFVELGLTVAYLPAFLLSALMRCVYILLCACLGIMRVDTSLLPTGTHSFDSPYVAFASLSLRSFSVEAPIVLCAVDMLRCTHHHNGDKSKAWLTTRNRFGVAILLNRFPTLIASRKRHLNQTVDSKETTSSDSDDNSKESDANQKELSSTGIELSISIDKTHANSRNTGGNDVVSII